MTVYFLVCSYCFEFLIKISFESINRQQCIIQIDSSLNVSSVEKNLIDVHSDFSNTTKVDI